MASVIKNTNRIDEKILKSLSRMYENGISLKDIADELEMDQITVKRLLKLLGYAFEEQ